MHVFPSLNNSGRVCRLLACMIFAGSCASARDWKENPITETIGLLESQQIKAIYIIPKVHRIDTGILQLGDSKVANIDEEAKITEFAKLLKDDSAWLEHWPNVIGFEYDLILIAADKDPVLKFRLMNHGEEWTFLVEYTRGEKRLVAGRKPGKKFIEFLKANLLPIQPKQRKEPPADNPPK